jgi:hypothetical protein
MKIKCPFCNIVHEQLMMNASEVPDMAPFLCGHCKELGIFVDGTVIKPTEEELAAIKSSPAYRDFLKLALEIRKNVDN